MPSTIDYRHLARASLKRSVGLQEAGDDYSLIYAALELRMAMEALTYERALAFKEDFPPSEYDIWQPKKVMSVLLEIDGNADKDSSLAVGVEEEFGKGSKIMESMGKETVLNMATIVEHYNALNSFLHIPTARQLTSGKGPNFKRLREHCEEFTEYLAKVLSSPVWGLVFRNYAQFKCEGCGKNLRRHMPHATASMVVECFENKCLASYKLSDEGAGKFSWEAEHRDIKCPSKACDGVSTLWRREITPNSYWPCPSCSKKVVVALGVTLLNEASPEQ